MSVTTRMKTQVKAQIVKIFTRLARILNVLAIAESTTATSFTIRATRAKMRTICALTCVFIRVATAIAANAQTLTDNQLSDIRFDQKLGAQISLDLPFRDENGKIVTIRDYFRGKPVVLVLGY